MKFLRRFWEPKGGKDDPPSDLSKFTDDWRPGDLAVTIFAGPWLIIPFGIPTDGGPKRGQLVRVLNATVDGRIPVAVLELRDWPGLWQANCFRKVPPEEIEPCSEEFRRSMGRKKSATYLPADDWVELVDA